MVPTLLPQPIFDTYAQFKRLTFASPYDPDTPSVKNLISALDERGISCSDDYRYAVQFLLLHCRKSTQTFNAFRTEIERLLLWSWLIKAKPAIKLSRIDLEEYIDFCMLPPVSWVIPTRQHHFIEENGLRIPNKQWAPFRIEGDIGSGRAKIKRSPAQATLVRQFSTLNVFLNHLLLEGMIDSNPIPIIKKHSPYLIRDSKIKTVQRLSDMQWDFVLSTIEKIANENPKYERNLFAVVLMKSCYLRISEISDKPSWQPLMEHFHYKKDYLWFRTLGKGNKLRDISVPDGFIPYLERYRLHRRLSPMPVRNENEPLLHKLKGQGGPSHRQAARIIEESFEFAACAMKQEGFIDEAVSLMEATTHWLRHTGASMDIGNRPLKHLADDLGHASLSTTDRIYVQSDDLERAESGRNRKI